MNFLDATGGFLIAIHFLVVGCEVVMKKGSLYARQLCYPVAEDREMDSWGLNSFLGVWTRGGGIIRFVLSRLIMGLWGL